MAELYNLLNSQPKLYDGPTRNMDPTFGLHYFDGSRDTGYGGYHYDGRWKPIAQAAVRRYGLRPKQRVLDVGCGKGFFLVDLLQVCPGVEVRGIDVSAYAVANAHHAVRPFVSVGSADCLTDFADHSFDFVCAMNSLHFLPPERVAVALQEIMRVGKNGRYFVQLDAFTTEVERERLLAWAPIIQTVYSVEQWLRLFAEVGYDGDYYWTFVRPLSACA
jgi:ubiquinone/menaquinone biosynthesis C-methylase UbiE